MKYLKKKQTRQTHIASYSQYKQCTRDPCQPIKLSKAQLVLSPCVSPKSVSRKCIECNLVLIPSILLWSADIHLFRNFKEKQAHSTEDRVAVIPKFTE